MTLSIFIVNGAEYNCCWGNAWYNSLYPLFERKMKVTPYKESTVPKPCSVSKSETVRWISLWWYGNGATTKDWLVAHKIVDFSLVGVTSYIEASNALGMVKTWRGQRVCWPCYTANGTAVLGSVINEVWEQTFQWVGRVGEVVMVLLREWRDVIPYIRCERI